MTMAARRAALVGTAVVLAAIAGCAGRDRSDFDPEPKPVAEVEAGALAQAQRVAETVGRPLTNWRTRIERCDVANPGRAWGLVGQAKITIPGGGRAAALRAISDRYRNDGWELGADQLPSEASPSASGHILAADPDSDFNVGVETGPRFDALDVVVSTSTCYDAVDGENPANA